MATCEQTQSEPNIYEVGNNDQGQPVLAAGCSCGWRHMTAYTPGARRAAVAEQYLRERFIDHKEGR